MLEESLFGRIDDTLDRLGARKLDGEEFREPPLDVLEYRSRRVRVSWVPVLGRALSVVAIVRRPVDLPFDDHGCSRLIDRLGRAINTRFPRFGADGGLAVGLVIVEFTSAAIGPDDEAILERALLKSRMGRVLPFGWFRINLGQEALALALRRSEGGVFSESVELADLLSSILKRYVPLVRD